MSEYRSQIDQFVVYLRELATTLQYRDSYWDNEIGNKLEDEVNRFVMIYNKQLESKVK